MLYNMIHFLLFSSAVMKFISIFKNRTANDPEDGPKHLRFWIYFYQSDLPRRSYNARHPLHDRLISKAPLSHSWSHSTASSDNRKSPKAGCADYGKNKDADGCHGRLPGGSSHFECRWSRFWMPPSYGFQKNPIPHVLPHRGPQP